jgi:molybdate transport system substrate-binding protein
MALTAALSVLLGACGGQTASPSPPITSCCDPTAPPVELTIYAAASLKGALEEVKSRYEALSEVVTLVISTDSSAALEAKIEQGAPADVFLSADTANPQKLVDGGFATEPVMTFASNKLTVIVPTDNPGGLASPRDLIKPGVKVIAAGPTVPITTYARQLLENLAKENGYPADFPTQYAANVMSEEENVAAVVAKIELGQGDAAIGYVTDAATSTGVQSIEISPSSNVAASYAGVVVRSPADGAHAFDEATAFLEWLAGAEGQAILASFGFQPPLLT